MRYVLFLSFIDVEIYLKTSNKKSKITQLLCLRATTDTCLALMSNCAVALPVSYWWSSWEDEMGENEFLENQLKRVYTQKSCI